VKTDGLQSSAWKRSTAILAVFTGGTPVLPRRLGRMFPAAFGLLLVLFSASCGSVPKTHYYTLHIPGPPARNDPKTPFVLGVEHFRAAERLRDDRIVYYESPTEMNFYENHRWGADPASMLSELALEWIQRTGAFTDVRMLPIREPVDYILRGRVLNFEEVDYEGEGKGRVNVELSMVRTRDHKVVWSFQRLAETPVEEKGMAGVARALNDASDQLFRDALPGLITQAEQDYQAIRGQTPEAENKHL